MSELSEARDELLVAKVEEEILRRCGMSSLAYVESEEKLAEALKAFKAARKAAEPKITTRHGCHENTAATATYGTAKAL